ncbi:MAG TPA: ATP-binding protein [Spirochaetota bacterium]|nr:ATP-binding protein [Spirochaetota bacterium]HPJ36309.1 ATP-binding protein [Spirochaetota bacterium]
MDDFNLLNRVIDTSPHIICIIDENDIIQWQNSYSEKFFKKDTTGENIRKLLSIESGPLESEKTGVFTSHLKTGKKELILEHRIISAGREPDSGLRVVISEDKTEQVRHQQLVHSLLKLESILTRLALESINIPFDEIDTHINKILKLITRFAGVDRSFIALFENSNDNVKITHDWCAKNYKPTIYTVKRADTPPSWWKKRKSEAIMLPDITKIKYPSNSGHIKIFSKNVKSAMLIPLYFNNISLGYLGFTSVKPIKEFSDILKTIFKISAELIVNLYERKSAYTQIEIAETIVAKSSGMLAYFDSEGIIRASSEAFQEFHKIRKTRKYIHIADLFKKRVGSGTGVEKIFESISEALNGKESKNEIWLRQDNRVVLMEISLHPAIENGVTKGVVMNSIDITERVQLETKILEVMHQERKRVGITLHDDLGHDLLAVAIKSRLLSDKLKDVSEELSCEAGEIEKALRACIGDVRDLSHGLIPYKNYGLEFREMLDAVALTISRNYKIKSEFNIDPELDIKNESIIKELYYIIDEAVMNSLKHSGCTHIIISMYRQKKMIILKIVDNGRGISNNKQSESGAGLEIMKYRARAIGGLLEVKNNPGGGTSIECTFSDKKNRV